MDSNNSNFKKHIQFNLKIGIAGAIIGVFVLIYLSINPLDESKYDYYPYYINSKNKNEESFISTDINDVKYLIKYYDEISLYEDTSVCLEVDNGNYIIARYGSKAKIIDTINSSVVKIELLYTKKECPEKLTIRGYIPLRNLHKNKPVLSSK